MSSLSNLCGVGGSSFCGRREPSTNDFEAFKQEWGDRSKQAVIRPDNLVTCKLV